MLFKANTIAEKVLTGHLLMSDVSKGWITRKGYHKMATKKKSAQTQEALPVPVKVKVPPGQKAVTAGSDFGEFVVMEKPGDSFAGVYTETGVIETKFGEQRVHRFLAGEDGETPFTVGGSYDLDRKLFQVPFGNQVTIVLTEIKSIKDGDQTFKKFSVFIDENVKTNPLPEDES